MHTSVALRARPLRSRLRGWLLAGALALGAPVAGAQEIVVSAAASLTNAFARVGTAWEAAHPGWKVRFNFAASGALLAQMRQGAPVDVFASADSATMDKAAAAQLIAAPSRVDFARNELVLVVPARAAAAATPRALGDLQDARYARIGAGTPASVPVGHYTLQAIEQAGLAATLQPRWIYGESVRQVLDYVARGEVDAGFVYRTDAQVRAQDVRVAFAVPTREPVRYPIAVLAGSRQAQAAQSFVDFVRGAAGQQILAQFGFSAP